MTARPAVTERAALAEFRKARPLFFDVAAEVHPERWRAVGLTPEAGQRLAKCPRSRATLSRDLSWTGGARTAPAFDWNNWNASAPVLRSSPGEWALLPGADIWRRAVLFGAGCFRAEIAKLVFRADVEAFRVVVGEAAHMFALRTAPMIWRDAAPLPGLPASGSLAERVLKAAALALGCWLAALPEEIAARAALKLPASCDADMAAATEWPPEQRRMWMDLLQKIQ